MKKTLYTLSILLLFFGSAWSAPRFKVDSSWDMTAPPPIGATTPNTGKHSTLDVTGAANFVTSTHASTATFNGPVVVNGSAGFQGTTHTTVTTDGIVLGGVGRTTWPSGGGGSTSPLTAKGDIWVYGSADMRLPASSAYQQVLVTDWTSASGLAWSGGLLINSSDIFVLATSIQEQHGIDVLQMTQGFVGDFQDTTSSSIIDTANSTGYTYNTAGKYYAPTAGGTNLNSDQDYTAESNYETYDYSGTTATIATDTITITTGTFPSNAVGMRFSPENPFNPANSAAIASYTDSTHIVLVSGHGLTASNSAWTLRSFQISSGVAKLSGVPGATTLTISGSGTDVVLGIVGWNKMAGQTFSAPASGNLTSVKFRVKTQTGYTAHTTRAYLYATSAGAPTGAAIATSDQVSAAALSTSYQQITYTFSTPYSVASGTTYAVAIDADGATDYTAPNGWRGHVQGSTTSVYANGSNWNMDTTIWAETSTVDLDVEISIGGGTNNVINEYVPIIPTYANLAAVSTWSDVNSFARTETLNSANVWYLVFKTAQSGWGANTELGVHETTTGTYRKVAINSAGTWQYNSNATYASETLTNSAINTLAGAIREALTVAANRMDGSALSQSMDASLTVPAGKAGIVPILYSTVNTNNPQVDQTRINYDATDSAMDLRTKAFTVTSAPTSIYLFTIDQQTSGTPTWYVSRNGGTNWTSVSPTLVVTLADGRTIRRWTGDATGMASGTDLRARVVTTPGDNFKIYSIGEQSR